MLLENKNAVIYGGGGAVGGAPADQRPPGSPGGDGVAEVERTTDRPVIRRLRRKEKP
jgi:hypothetical protein